MAHADEDMLLTQAHLALEASVIGRALLDCDWQEARFRACLLRAEASDRGLDGIARAAVDVLGFLRSDHAPPKAGIGWAMLRLTVAIDAEG